MLRLADAVLIVHFGIAAFIALGFVLVPLGAWRHWRFVRRRRLRLAHLGAILFVAAESIVGVACPLTVWENALRGVSEPDGFIAHWVRYALYYDAPLWLFGAIYIAAASIAVAAWWIVPPTPRRKHLRDSPSPG